MKKTISILLILSLTYGLKAQEQLPKVVSGKIERIEYFESKYISARNIDIWLPEGYSESKKYSVLYMHDGQMLFDPENTWNKQAWNIDDIASGLLANNRVKEFIIVGIWNGDTTRHADYFPQKPFESLSTTEKDTVTNQLRNHYISLKKDFMPKSDDYLRFIVEELKPYIDKTYPVYRKSKNTYIAGSSMGGLISIYAICEYPKVFGGAACLSTHWVGTFTLLNNPVPKAFLRYLKYNLPSPNTHKIYFDYGNQTLDSLYPEIQNAVDSLMQEKGYQASQWKTLCFPNENHSEKAWNKRLHIPLEFLLAK